MSTSVLPPNQPIATAATSLEQIREILVGAHMKNLERRLARIEDRFSGELQQVRKELLRRFEVIEAHVHDDSQDLSGRIESERGARAEALASAGREWRETASALDQRLSKLDDALAHSQRELRQQMLEQAKAFFEETRRMRDEILATLQRELEPPVDTSLADRGNGLDREPTPLSQH